MADFSKRLETNAKGIFFVDSTCINCDTCRQLAPATFIEKGDYSAVFHQPETTKGEFTAYQTLIGCLVRSIGKTKKLHGFFKGSSLLPVAHRKRCVLRGIQF